jgi:tetratricopeptide (TPR) repeat protein
MAQGRPDSAIDHVTQSLQHLQIDSCSHRLFIAADYLLRAEALARMGDLEASRIDIEFVVNNLGDEPRVLAEANVNLATICIMQENYGQARQYLLSAMDLAIVALGSKHPVIGNCLNNLAYIEVVQKNWARAEAYELQSLAIKEAALGLSTLDW